MNMQTRTQELMSILRAFKDATEAKDWDKIKSLDEDFRNGVEAAVTAMTDADSEQLAAFLKKAQAVYRLVQSGADKNKAEIREALMRLSKEQKAVASYENSAKW